MTDVVETVARAVDPKAWAKREDDLQCALIWEAKNKECFWGIIKGYRNSADYVVKASLANATAALAALEREGFAIVRGWQDIETHCGLFPVLVCRKTGTETWRATSAFLDATGVWRLFHSEGGNARLPFEPTHWCALPDQPAAIGKGEQP